jgi:hypothetical protein
VAKLGFTFSQRQAAYLAVPWDEAYDAALQLAPTILRLGAYWDEIEPTEGTYDWTTLDAQLDRAADLGLDVVLTVGMKAPRWPEFFLPTWLERRVAVGARATVSDCKEVRCRTLEIVERVVRRYRGHEAVAYWQVENEPLDPSGPRHWKIGADVLAQEVGLIRRLDDRPVIATMFVEVSPMLLTPWRRRVLGARASALLGLADVLGLDLYPIRSFRSGGRNWYVRWPGWMWRPALVELWRLAQRMGRRAWIMEAQAEPWEPDRVVYTDERRGRSEHPNTAAATARRLESIGFDTILLWGVEHWHMRRTRHQNTIWWDRMLPFFPRASAAPSGGRPGSV